MITGKVTYDILYYDCHVKDVHSRSAAIGAHGCAQEHFARSRTRCRLYTEALSSEAHPSVPMAHRSAGAGLSDSTDSLNAVQSTVDMWLVTLHPPSAMHRGRLAESWM